MINFLVGFLIGGAVGPFASALCRAAREDEEDA
ncbi:MAG: DUF3789 domain-containing protein [Clostridiales bacterium]|nr:DUF3789 domain-containing protein [Clostridiales bacterium]